MKPPESSQLVCLLFRGQRTIVDIDLGPFATFLWLCVDCLAERQRTAPRVTKIGETDQPCDDCRRRAAAEERAA